jgi:hypothetical protein
MLTFRTISMADRPWITAALQQSQFQGCEYCFSNNLAWYRAYDSRIASFQGFYIIAAFGTEDGIPDVTVPSGSGDWDALLRELRETLCPHGEPLRLTGVTREMAAFLQTRFPDAVWQPDAAAFDYIYHTEDLIALKGKRYHKKRNHLHQFRNRYDWTFSELTEADAEACIAFSANLYNQKDGYSDRSSVVEQYAIHTFFTHFQELGLCGGVLRVAGKLVGFSIGEPLNRNTFVTHIEKADIAYQGAYTALTQAFTERFAAGYPYLNREEDLGIAGLRQAKASYYPAYLLEKGTLCIL